MTIAAATETAPLRLAVGAASHEELRAACRSIGEDIRAQLQAGRHLRIGEIPSPRRARGPVTAVALGRDAGELARALQSGSPSSELVIGEPRANGHGIALVFDGQGLQRRGMARGLYEELHEMRTAIDECDAELRALTGRHLTDLLLNQEQDPFPGTAAAQPALYAFEIGLASAWRAHGLEPTIVAGHSAGEIAALCVCGALSVRDGLRLAATRGELMEERMDAGALVVVFGTHRDTEHVAAEIGFELAITNGPGHRLFGGPSEMVESLLQRLAGLGLNARAVQGDRAFHTSAVQPVLAELGSYAASLAWRPTELALISGSDGNVIPPGATLGSEHVTSHARSPTRFDLVVGALQANSVGCAIEIGSSSALSRTGEEIDPTCTWIPARRARATPLWGFYQDLAQAYCHGAQVQLGDPPATGDQDATVTGGGQHLLLEGSHFALHARPIAASMVHAEEARQSGGTQPMGVGEPQDANDAGDRATVLATIRELVAHELGVETHEVEPQISFFDLGADSLAMVNLLREVEQAFEVRVAMRELFEDVDSPDRLAALICVRQPRPICEPAMSSEDPIANGDRAAQIHQPVAPAPPGDPPPLVPEFEPLATADEPAAEPLVTSAAFAAAPESAGNSPELSLLRRQATLVEELSRTLTRHVELLSAGNESAQVPSSAERREGLRGPPPAALTHPTAATEGFDSSTLVVHGPHVPTARDGGMTAGGLSQTQERHLSALIAEFNHRTAGSKRLAARFRPVLADSRAIVGFRDRTKEMLYPIAGRSANGSRLEDVDGNSYVDITMGFGILLFGHEPTFVTEAVAQHLSRGLQLGPRSEDTGVAAELLCRLTGVERVAFATSGTEANSAALRLARAATGRSKVVIFHGAYHGHFDGVLARGVGRGTRRRTLPVAPGIPDTAVADVIVLSYDEPASLETIAHLGPELAAVLVEPVQSRFPGRQPRAFLRELRRVTTQTGTVLIFDEMLTGFRPHIRGAQGIFAIDADLVTYGKVLGGGYPIGAVAGRATLMDGVDGGQWVYGDDSYPTRETTFFGGTYIQHPVAMAAARAILSHLKEQGPAMQEALNRKTDRLARELNEFLKQEQFPLRLVHFGSQFRFELHDDAELLFPHLLLKGVYVWEWRNFFLSTAHSDEDVSFVIDAVKTALLELRQAGFLARGRPAARSTGATSARAAPPTNAKVTAPPPPPLTSLPDRSMGARDHSSRVGPVGSPHGSAASPKSPRFSLYYFGDYPLDTPSDARYELLLESARFADEDGFHALWIPERHFHSFGGIFPNPSILAAALARETRRIRLHAGCVVLPLHNPIRVAEEWAVVDNLSGGRVGLGFASGWHANDFALAPDVFGRHREVMYESCDTVRRLWRGERVRVKSGSGESIEIAIHPTPLQAMPPMYTAIVGNPESYRMAARQDLGVVTNLMTQDIEQLTTNIELYRREREAAGLDPAAGQVVALLHTYLADSDDQARAEAFEPFCRYMRSSLSLFGQVTNSLGMNIDLANSPPADVDFLLARAYARYCDTRALIGSLDAAAKTVQALRSAGVDEIAFFVDFGVSIEQLRCSMPHMSRLRDRFTVVGATTLGGAVRSNLLQPALSRAPLALAQERMWFTETLVEQHAYNEARAIRLKGPLVTGALAAALQDVVSRHDVLRTVIAEEDGTPYQEVRESAEIELAVAACEGHAEETEVARAMGSETDRSFDLANGPLMVARLLRIAHEHHVLVLSVHHIVFDTLSAKVFTEELSACYKARLNGVDPPPGTTTAPYTNYAKEQRAGLQSPEVRAAVEHTCRRLSPLPEPLELPASRPRPRVFRGHGASVFRVLDRNITDALKTLARELRGTPFIVLLSAFAATLRAASGQSRFVIGTPIADRPKQYSNTLGLFVNTLALPIDLRPGATFREVVGEARATMLDAHEHVAAPFEEVVRRLNPPRDTSRNPIFQVMIEFEGEAIYAFDLPRVKQTMLEAGAAKSPFDLTLYLSEVAGETRCHFEYATDLFDLDTIEALADLFAGVLAACLANPEAAIEELLRAIADRDQTLLQWEAGETVGAAASPVAKRIAATYDRQPESIAIESASGERMSYGQLGERIDNVAAALREAGVNPGQTVALALPQEVSLPVAMLATLRARAAYVPIDSRLPERRQELMAGDASVRVTVVEAAEQSPTWLPPGSGVVRLHRNGEVDGVVAAAQRADDALSREDLAYVLYTSGSTGIPKGVAMPGRAVANLVDWHCAVHPPTRTLQYAAPGFDVCSEEILTTLAGGGTLIMTSPDTKYDPRALLEVLHERQIERLFIPVAPLGQLLAIAEAPKLQALREIIVAGEQLLLGDNLRHLMAINSELRVFNEYGPTETHVVSFHQLTAEEETHVPIGRPVPRTSIRLLDRHGRRVVRGAVGELCVTGAQVAVGYLGRDGETAERFVPDRLATTAGDRVYHTGDLARWRPDGLLAFVGRTDDQLKIRGHRVEPGEVAVALKRLPIVSDAVVIAWRTPAGEPGLAAYLVPSHLETDDTTLVAELRRRLEEELPAHMVPVAWTFLTRIPTNLNGKVDLSALPVPEIADLQALDSRPDTDLEEMVHQIWCDELQLDAVGMDSSFFDVGGHSLSAIRLVNRMRAAFNCDIRVMDVFENRTISKIATLLAARSIASPGSADRTVDDQVSTTVAEALAVGPGERVSGRL